MATLANGQHLYTEEEEDWIRENLDNYTHPELQKMFNERFGTTMKSGLTDHIIKTMGLHKSINRGNCKKGERRCKNTLPVGSESFDGFNLYIKIADNVNDCKNRRMPLKRNDPNWMRKDYKVWQDHGHELPKDSNEMLIHLNRDKRDCRIENLYMTTRTINLFMSKNGWYSENPEITLAGLKWCELFYALKEKKKIRICKHCGQEFKAKHQTHTFCSKSCARRWKGGDADAVVRTSAERS